MKLENGVFVTLTGKKLSISAKQTKAGRWQYRDTETNKLYASGITPAEFCRRFWLRDDFQE